VVPVWCLPMLSPPCSRSLEKRKPSNSSGLGYKSSSVWIALSGATRSVPAGTVMPLENVNGRIASRPSTTRKNWHQQLRRKPERTKGRTNAYAVYPLSLSQETVNLVHFIQSSFRPAFLGHGGFDFLTEGFDILWIGKKAVERLGERLVYMQVLRRLVDFGTTMQLTIEVVWIDAKLTPSIRLAKPSRDLSGPLASFMSHMNMSSCTSANQQSR
jgi:hypothetical protein